MRFPGFLPMRIAASVGVCLGSDISRAATDPVPLALVSPASNALNVSTSPTLQVQVSDSNSANLTMKFYARRAVDPGPDFMITALPDSQYLSETMNGGTPAVFLLLDKIPSELYAA
jgi:hypothetical protein